MNLFSWTKKKPEPPREPAPCGDDKAHYAYLDVGWSCPVCAAAAYARAERELIAVKERLQAEKDAAFAEKVANAVVRALKEHERSG